MAMAGGERKAWLDRINGRVTSKTVDLSIGGAWSRSKTLAAASSRSPTGISKEEADKQFVAKLAQQERDLCIAYRDVATFRLRWMVKGLDNKMKKVSQAAPNESVDESILRTVCKLVKNPVDSLCKNFTDVEAWRSGGGTILQHSILNDNKEQTRQLIRIRRKEAETEIVQQRQHVEQQLSEERMSINQHAASATRDTESEYQTKLASMAEELQHEEEALALQEQRTTMAKEAAVKSNKNHKQVGDVMRGQQDELRAQVWEMEKRLANLQKEIQTKRETVRGLEKDAAAKTKIANAKEQKNAKAMEKTAKKRMSGLMASRSFSNNRSSAGGGVPPPYQRGRRSGLVMVTPEMATSVDYGEGTRHSTPEDGTHGPHAALS
jgi:chromosome segregation ATPase